MPTARKGLHDIPSRQARGRQALPAYSLYMQISCIEMEKIRRELELSAAQRRMLKAEQRLAELEREKALLVAALGEPSAPAPASAAGADPGGIRIKY